MKLLIIEDEPDLVSTLAAGFSQLGYITEYATDGSEGYELACINKYDLIILDLNLPSMDGIEILKAIRAEDKEQRILILSARSSVEDKVTGLDFGANDYLSKPFAFAELEARVRSLLRRSFIQRDTSLKYDILTVDTRAKSVTAGDKKLELAPKEYLILEYLRMHMGKVISSEELIEHVWHSDANYFTSSVKVHMSNLRKKLTENCGMEMITTVRGSGYIIGKEGTSGL